MSDTSVFPSGNTAITSTTGTTPTTSDPVQLVIPEETKKRFPDLVAMILQSQSMNNEERNYWLQVLPVMTDSQVTELRDILETEKRKLAEIEAKYAQKPTAATPSFTAQDLARMEAEKQKKREQMAAQEKAARSEENPDDILAMLG